MAKAANKRITKTIVDGIAPGETVQDCDVAGFGVRRQKGAASYFLKTYVNGRRRFFTIGKHGTPWTPDSARKEARRFIALIQQGEDPGASKRDRREAATLDEVATRFLSEHGPTLRKSTLVEYTRIIDRHIRPSLGSRKLFDLTREDVAKLHVSLKATPRMANLVLAVVSAILGWCETQGLRPYASNFCPSIPRFPEVRRERFLSQHEFERLGKVLCQAQETGSENIYCLAAIRLLILTGARLNEILSLKWQYVDLRRQTIFLPTSKTGQKPLFLNQAACDVLSDLPRLTDNAHVLPGAKVGAHLVNLQKPWRRIRKLAGIEDVRLHDLRHSFASVAVERGASLPLIGQLLGHSQPQTTQRYAHLAAEPVREVNEVVGSHLARVLAPKK